MDESIKGEKRKAKKREKKKAKKKGKEKKREKRKGKKEKEKGTMSEDDWDTYKSLFEAMVLSPYFEKPDLIIYLEGDIDHVVNRINERGRDMEVQTDVEYWRELDNRYKTWIDEINDMRVLRLNINEYDVHDDDSMTVIVEKIKKIVNA